MKLFKAISFYLFLQLIQISAFSQVSVEFSQPVYEFEMDANAQKIVMLPITVKGALEKDLKNILVSISRNDNPELYTLGNDSFNLSTAANGANIILKILPATLVKHDTVSLIFTDPLTKKIRLANVYIKKPEEKDDLKKKSGRIMFMNAYNFDFGGNLAGSNYVGHLNIYSPAMGSTEKWAFNSGIMKINYSQKDTSLENDPVLRENLFISHFDTLGAGLKYLRRLTRYSTIKKNQVWSFYFQPMFQIHKTSNSSRIFLHLHTELLASKWTATTTFNPLFQDTAVFNPGTHSNFSIRYRYDTRSVYTINSLSGYFGAGLTYDMKLWNKGEFVVQGTIGFTTNKASPTSTDLDVTFSGNGGDKAPTAQRNLTGFFLIRANYIQKLSETSNVVIGTDIRGFVSQYAPQYAAYIGLNVGLESVLKLITGDKKE